MKTKFNVEGMSCSSCVAGIEKNLNKQLGIKETKVFLMDKSMEVIYDENIVSPTNIIEIVNKLGYNCTLYKNRVIKSHDNVMKRFIFSVFLLIPLMYLSMGEMLNFIVPPLKINICIQFLLTTIIIIINKNFFINGTRAVINKSPNMDTLVAISASGSFIYSVVTGILILFGKDISAHLFFESAAMVVTLVTLGKWLEEKSKRKTSKEIEKLTLLVPNEVTVLTSGKLIKKNTNDLQVNEIIVFKMGEYIAVDGEVQKGNAFIDTSAITGESLPVEVKEKDQVISGSVVKSGYIEVLAKKVGNDTLFSKIIISVKNASLSKAKIQQLVDKVASYFVPIACLIAIMTFIVWIFISQDLYKSFNFSLSVLVISCPCALGLATPVAIMASSGKAASLGILYKDADAIQKAEKINCVLLDKTATITIGEPRVVYYEDLTIDNNLQIAASIESHSEHPLAACILDFAKKEILEISDYEYIVGKGAVAKIGNIKYYIGNSALIEHIDVLKTEEIKNKFEKLGYTVVYLANDEEIMSVFCIADIIKEDSKEAISKLTKHKIKTVMVTGDNFASAKMIASQAGISEFEAEVLPNEKVNVLLKYKNEGFYCAMCGDGINDSPAIKSSDVGIAVGNGTDIAIDSADIVIVSGSLKGIIDAILLSKKSNRIIKENLFWAFIYNLIAIPIAAGVLSGVGFILTPAIAAICMCLSSLFVVTNALRIFSFKSIFKKTNQEITNLKGNDNMLKIYVDGMMCMKCKKHVEEALLSIAGVTSVEIELATKEVKIYYNQEPTIEEIEKVISLAGYILIK